MANDEENIGNAKQQLIKLFEHALRITVPSDSGIEPSVAACVPKFGDYQCNNAMRLWPKLKGQGSDFPSSLSVGKAIMNNLPSSEMIESCSVVGPGFVNVVLSNKWLAKTIQKMLVDGMDAWAPKLSIKRAVVDFSSPNIAEEMHVEHLRSTIIGDSVARMLEFSKVEVLRRNHVGDCGAQFGMLIEFLFEEFPNSEDINEAAIRDLQEFYKKSKKRFDDDPIFKEKAQRAVVLLQKGELKYRRAWDHICEIGRKEFNEVYKRLEVQLEEKGESSYYPLIPAVIKELTEKQLVVESQGASVIKIDGINIPLIVVKSDGGYNYASTDLAALWYRLNVEKADWIIYVTDVRQQQHFNMFFKAAKLAGWISHDDLYPKCTHVDFGLVLGTDGKGFRTSSNEVDRLVDLLDEAKSHCKEVLESRGDKFTEGLERTAEAVGYGAVKYANLKDNRTTNCTFDFDQMLSLEGDTAVYLLYAHAEICSIIKESGKDIEKLKKTETLALNRADARALGVHLLQFPEIVEEALNNLLPSVLCKYLYGLSQKFETFYDNNRKVFGSAEEMSYLLLCESTAMVMRKCFHLLQITPVYKM